MKKVTLGLLSLSLLWLSGCALLEETTNSLNYAEEATAYVNDLNHFLEEASTLEADELRTELENLQTTITDFIDIDPPTIAEDIHEELKSRSEQLLDTTNDLMNQGEVTVEQIKNTELYRTIENIQSLQNQIEQLEL
ncbi:hypothetical protein CAI16_04300 [Virgibacillus dokdonensis]|uniref:Lipoprotein n=1 Tax=Virgibacillus dokdonensis TaxID=302167 RepID=A0A3E0WUE7_9BACI|nr:DUF6376 family protein [Virgibacillus dokdonensis]RFA36614.1 hypothetical protein CAI16_04300 [Virgibacillus dokdonensis]